MARVVVASAARHPDGALAVARTRLGNVVLVAAGPGGTLVQETDLVDVRVAGTLALADGVAESTIKGGDGIEPVARECPSRVVHHRAIVVRASQAVDRVIYLELVKSIWCDILGVDSDEAVPVGTGLLMEETEYVEHFVLNNSGRYAGRAGEVAYREVQNLPVLCTIGSPDIGKAAIAL